MVMDLSFTEVNSLEHSGVVFTIDIGLQLFLHHEDLHYPLFSDPSPNLNPNPNPKPNPNFNLYPNLDPNPNHWTSQLRKQRLNPYDLMMEIMKACRCYSYNCKNTYCTSVSHLN